MSSKNIILSIAFSIYSILSFAQYNTQTEYRYLKFINSQNKTDLIKDNIKNAELVANNLLVADNTTYTSLFFTELSKSHNIIDDSETAFYYTLCQRILFPNTSTSSYIHNTFFHNAYAIQLNDSLSSVYWKMTSEDLLPKTYSNKLLLLMELSIKLHSEKLTKHISNLGIILKQQQTPIPTWYTHWEYLTNIGFTAKEKINLLSFEKDCDKNIYTSVDKKQRLKIYSKAINYYIHNGSITKASSLLVEYKKQNHSLLQKIDACIKGLRIKCN